MPPVVAPAHKPLAEASILITGLIRNGEHCVRQDVQKLLAATTGFRKTQVLIIESDSTDDTVTTLASMAAKTDKVHYRSLGRLDDVLPTRTERLAHCRNAYISAVRDDPRYADVDYILVSDLDGMNNRLNAAAIRSCFDVQENWGVLTANQDGHYYDIWALRHPDWSPNDCLRLLDRLEPVFGHEAARDIAVYSRQVRISPNAPPIAVQSAFGGLSLYARDALLAGGYEAFDENGIEICEHVPHHLKIGAAGYGIYINPRLINTGLTIHTRNKRTSKIIKNAIRAHFKHQR